MKVLVFDPELCTGCHVCEETCSRTWFKAANVEKSRIRVSERETSPGRYDANGCNQCGECMDVCPTVALARDKRGIVRLDEKLCVGCLACVGFCPILAMRVHVDHATPFKCVACGKCTKECPEGALAVEQLADAALTETEMRMKVVA